MAVSDIPKALRDLYEIHEWRHASAVLMKDFPGEWQAVVETLKVFRLLKTRIAIPGGSKSLVSKALEAPLNRAGWVEREFETAISVDQVVEVSPTHKVDCFKNKVGLEIEWNNKDPFFDRDLNNFRLLFDLRALSVGIIITRSDALQDVFNRLGRGSSYGNSTTHMSKLLPRLRGGAGGGCPVLVFGITPKLLEEDIPDDQVKELQTEFALWKKSKRRDKGPLLSLYFSDEELVLSPEENDA